MKSSQTLTLLLPLLFMGLSCEIEKDGCCPDSPTSYEIGNGKIYVPNIFTPNADGTNDIFYPLAGQNIQEIKDFYITDGKGTVLFVSSSTIPNDPSSVWNPSEYVYVGKFRYFFTAVSTDGTESKIAGSACCYPYWSAENDWECLGCHFATQHDGFGGLCDNCPSYESICK